MAILQYTILRLPTLYPGPLSGPSGPEHVVRLEHELARPPVQRIVAVAGLDISLTGRGVIFHDLDQTVGPVVVSFYWSKNLAGVYLFASVHFNPHSSASFDPLGGGSTFWSTSGMARPCMTGSIINGKCNGRRGSKISSPTTFKATTVPE